MAGTLYLGTSGFAYDMWKGVFYPETTKNREMLPYYATRFDSVEINYTFRRFPSEETLAKWRDAVPADFRFTLKANQRITHKLKLRDAADDTQAFVERARTLGDRLGTVFFQCPPYLRFDRDLIGSFLSTLPEGTRYAMEFRHASWEEARPLLSEAGVAWCTAETDEGKVGPVTFEPFGFLRLRKEDYTGEELRAWAERIRPALADGHDVFCYLKHEDEGAAPRLALRLERFLED